MDRATPYHRPHTTQVAGYAFIIGGDDRWVGNVFVGGDPATAYGPGREGAGQVVGGTAGYDAYPASFDEYMARIAAQPPGDHQRFLDVKQPVYARGNVYAAGAAPFAGEHDALVLSDATASVAVEGDAVYLETKLPVEFDGARLEPISGRDLERVRFADADFEEPDGTPAVMDVDVTGEHKQQDRPAAAGPIADLRSGSSRTRVWVSQHRGSRHADPSHGVARTPDAPR
jgi:hypothetical protein